MKPLITIKKIAFDAHSMPARSLFFLKNGLLAGALMCSALLAGCATPQSPVGKAVYDFGVAQSVVSAAVPVRNIPLVLPEIEAGAGLDSPALLYRLQYQDAQQLRPYAQARWSVPPAQLVRSRLREALAAQGPVLPQEGVAMWTLRVDLDEFSQVFATPESSQGTVRLRASLFKISQSGEQLAAQTNVLTRSAAASQDAPGGVRALTAATDDAVRQIAAWVATQIKP